MKRNINKLLLVISVVLCNWSLFSQIPTNPYKAPLYWSVYEHHIIKEMGGVKDNYIPENEWLKNIEWVDANLKGDGYKMVCLDGWGDVSQLNEHGYRTSHSRHWEHNIAWWSNNIQERGMTLGIYGNPLWVHVDNNDQLTKIVGTNILVSSLKNPNEEAYFPWVQVDREGAEEYVKGYMKYYADMGIQYFRIDFLSWFEDGQDRYMGRVGPDRPQEHYVTALKWMREAADEYGMFLSLVMPHLYNEAAVELQYGHMVRINEDAGEGAWWKWAEKDAGIKREGWSVYANPFDGMTYWSYLTGDEKMILDPDFLRINTFANVDEKMSVVSLCLVAGAAVTIADQYSSIGSDLWVYKNPELLALNQEGFVAKPLINNPTIDSSQIWTGQMKNGDWIIALFNRAGSEQNRSIKFSSLGIKGDMQVRDLWEHKNIGSMNQYSAKVPAHGCTIIKLISIDSSFNMLPAMHVDSMASWVESGHAFVKVRLVNDGNDPVENADVSVAFTTSFNETVSGVTASDGFVTLSTSETVSGVAKNNVMVSDVSHPEYIYAGNKNLVSAIEDYRYVGGTYNNWSLVKMDWDNGVWTLQNVKFSTGVQQLKFANTNNWSADDWGNAIGLSGVAGISTGGKPNVKFNIEYAGDYTITFNEKTLAYSISPMHQNEMFVGGTFNNWSLSNTSMSLVNNQWFVEGIEMEAGDHELKLVNTSDWSGDDWGNASGLSGKASLSTGGDPNISFNIEKQGLYTIRFNDISMEYAIYEDGTDTGVDDGNKPSIKVFPNPVLDYLNIRSESNELFEVKIYSVAGELIYYAHFNNETSIRIKDIDANGLVFIEVLSENSRHISKIMIH